jgi:hypothetical protein
MDKHMNGVTPVSTRESAKASSEPKKRSTSQPAMVNDPILGPRRADVSHWRCRRVDTEDGQKGKLLLWSEGGAAKACEWPIKTCSPDALLERWGAGQYVVQYIKLDGGFRKPWGRSRVVSVAPPAAPPPPPPAEAPPPAPAPVSPPPVLPADANLSTMFSFLAYLDERNEKARVAAATETRNAVERVAAESKLALERYKVDMEIQLERERLASKERIAQIEAHARATPVRGERVDQEALAQRIGTLVDQRVREALDEYEDEPESRPAPANNPSAVTSQVLEAILPMVQLLAAKLAPPAPSLPNAPPPHNGSNGNDPNGGTGQ